MITEQIKKEIQNKEELTNKLNESLRKLSSNKIQEKIKRSEIITRLEAESTKKITDKSKQAYADSKLKDLIKEIEELKLSIDETKRSIDLCNDKISCYKYEIRELEIIKEDK